MDFLSVRCTCRSLTAGLSRKSGITARDCHHSRLLSLHYVLWCICWCLQCSRPFSKKGRRNCGNIVVLFFGTEHCGLIGATESIVLFLPVVIETLTTKLLLCSFVSVEWWGYLRRSPNMQLWFLLLLLLVLCSCHVALKNRRVCTLLIAAATHQMRIRAHCTLCIKLLHRLLS